MRIDRRSVSFSFRKNEQLHISYYLQIVYRSWRQKDVNIMKKSLRIFLFCCGIMSISHMSAGESPKDDVKYFGTKENGFSLSVGAIPALNFVGNMFNNTENLSFSGFGNTYNSSFVGDMLSVSYFIKDDISLTMDVGINRNKNKKNSYDDKDNVETIQVTGSNDFIIKVGANYLLRPGERIQPIIGASLMYGLANKNFEKVDDQTEVNADFNHTYPSKMLGIVCNVGVEFFICKNVSISTLADLSILKKKNKSKVDDWDENKTTINSVQTTFSTGQLGGNIAFNFYF